MKKRLLSFLAVALTGLLSYAQDWQKPTLSYMTDEVPQQAYIYNIETGRFLTKGGAWGTHASVKEDVRSAFLYEMQEAGEGIYKLYCAAGGRTGYLGRETAEDAYTDFNNKSGWSTLWEFTTTEGGYHLRTAASCPTWGYDKFEAEGAYPNYGSYVLGWNPEREDLVNNDPNKGGMGTFEGVYMVDPEDATGWHILWGFVTPDIYAVFKAQTLLYEEMNKALGMGFTAAELEPYAALLSVQDEAQINVALEELQEKVLTYAYEHASEESPFDVTSLIANPSLDGSYEEVTASWKDEFSTMKIQNNHQYALWDEELGEASTEYGLNNFIEVWTSSNTESVHESHFYQVLADLPQGAYILQADALATTGSADLMVSGAEVYAESGSTRFATSVNKNVFGEDGSELPRRYRVNVTHMGGSMKIGISLRNGHAKWLAADNFRLFYTGKVDNPGLNTLRSTLEAAKPYVENHGEEGFYYTEETLMLLKDAMEKAEGVTDSDACMALAAEINSVLDVVKAEIKAYADLKALVAKVEADMVAYEFIECLSEMYYTYQDAYEGCTASVEEIQAWTAGYHDTFLAGVKEAMKQATEENPIDITMLYENLSFEKNDKTNWNCESSLFKVSANVGEVWNDTFDAYTVLRDLPAGAYRITAHAFSRNGNSKENAAAEGAFITAEFYANNAAVKVASQHLGASTEKLYSNDENLTGDEASPLWVPNSRDGARAYFNVEDTPYFNTVLANVREDGDTLRIGFRDMGNGDGTIAPNSWTLWSDLRICYIGMSNSALYAELQQNIERAERLAQDCRVTEAVNRLDKAMAAAANVDSSASEEEITQAIAVLTEAIAYADEALALTTRVMNAYNEYQELQNEYMTSTDTKLDEILDDMGSAIADETFESNEVMQAWLDALPAARTEYVMLAMLEGAEPSEEEPVCITGVMSNPSFGTFDTRGWTVTNTGGALGGPEAQRKSSTAYEIWGATAFDIHQSVVGLREGYYRLTAKATFRNGGNSAALAAEYFAKADSIDALAQMYANDKAVNVRGIYQDAQTEDPAIDGQESYELDGQTYYTANTMISFEKYAMDLGLYNNTLDFHLDGNTVLTLGLRFESQSSAVWFPFDDFNLYYLGTTTPTAVSDITSVADPTAIYDLMGRKVQKASKGIKGIFIMNGKKIVK